MQTSAIPFLGVVALAFLLPGPAAFAQTADEVLARHLAAVGGRKALDRIKDKVETWTVTVDAFGNVSKGKLEVKVMQPDFILWTLELEAAGQPFNQIRGFDGKTAWQEDQGIASPMEGPELTELRNLALRTIGGELLWAEQSGAKIEMDGTTDLEGETALVVETTPKEGFKLTYYLDPETYLVLGFSGTTIQQGMEAELDARVTSYREVEGVRVPEKISVKAMVADMGIELAWQMKLDSVKFNSGLDKSDFMNPFGQGKEKPVDETKHTHEPEPEGKKRGWY
ncbi:MAG: hypothetical protein O7H41_07950 [Planctomycetota bacterium]|nr:hypothetical protein [Planctomycetota bacterium]